MAVTFPRHHTNDEATNELFHGLMIGRYDKDRLNAWLRKGADIIVTDNYAPKGNTFLTWIIANTAIVRLHEILETIQEFYVDHPEVFAAVINMKDTAGKSPLMFACAKGWQHQSESSMDPNRPFMHDAIQTLIDFGADINSEDIHGNTPLHIAMLRRDVAAIEYLISHGASLSAVNKQNLKPAQMLQYSHEEVNEMVSDLAVVYTLHSKTEFYNNYRIISKIICTHCADDERKLAGFPSAFLVEDDPALLREKATDLVLHLHKFFSESKYKDIRTKDVSRMLGQQGINIPPENKALGKLVKVVNHENKMATIFGCSSKYWDGICQFIKSIFGTDRHSVITKACNNYAQKVKQQFNFQPSYKQFYRQKIEAEERVLDVRPKKLRFLFF